MWAVKSTVSFSKLYVRGVPAANNPITLLRHHLMALKYRLNLCHCFLWHKFWRDEWGSGLNFKWFSHLWIFTQPLNPPKSPQCIAWPELFRTRLKCRLNKPTEFGFVVKSNSLCWYNLLIKFLNKLLNELPNFATRARLTVREKAARGFWSSPAPHNILFEIQGATPYC